MKIIILGNNSALPAHNRYPTCQVVNIDETYILVDCGEAAQILLKKHGISWSKIRHIFISHLHGDHYFGLVGLINSMSLLGRTEPLNLYAPAALSSMIAQVLAVADTVLSYPLHFIATQDTASILFENDIFSLKTFPVEHRIFCQGLLVTQKAKGRKLLPERCSYYEIPTAYFRQLKAGANYECKDGFVVKNEWVTEDGKPEKRYAFCADTKYTNSFLPHIIGADIIYHESTYLSAEHERAASRFHSTAQQAATIARAANAGQLILGHYSSKYKTVYAFEEEAKMIFPNSVASKEGDIFEI
ncbi:MAG: ribonuclease Z [Chitinophagaceae bacterium]|nr:ribonuclease Z [Chitinophagaceae bacterium]